MEKTQKTEKPRAGGERLPEFEFYRKNSKEALHEKLRDYIRRRLFSSRYDIPSANSTLLLRATLLEELTNVGDIIENVEQRLVSQEKEKHPDLDFILARVPETMTNEDGQSLKDAFRTFLGDYYEERNELDYFIREHPPQYIYEKIVGRPPKGTILQKRVLNSISWIFVIGSDCRDYYAAERGNTEEAQTVVKKIAGEVSAHVIDGMGISIVTYPNLPLKETVVHETRHVIFNAGTRSETTLNEKFNECASKNEKGLAEALHIEWGEHLKNELMAYLREAVEGDMGHVTLAYLTNFGEKGLYNYPKQYKAEAEKIYGGIPGASLDFEEFYKKIADAYYEFANEIVGRIAKEFNEIAYEKTIVFDESHTGPKDSDPDQRMDAEVMIDVKNDKNRISALRVLELYPIADWPKLLDRLDGLLDIDENDLIDEVSSWDSAVERDAIKEKDRRLPALNDALLYEPEFLKKFFETIRKNGKKAVSSVEEEKFMRRAEELEAERDEVLEASSVATQVWEDLILGLGNEGDNFTHSRISRVIGVAKFILDMKQEWTKEVAPRIQKHAVQRGKFLQKLLKLSEKFDTQLFKQ